MTIHKYPLKWEETQIIHIPSGAEPLALQPQNGVPTLWAKVDEDAILEPRMVRIFGTGALMSADPYRYLGTIQAGSFVFHFFMEVSL
jgi:hypothetical protein